MELLSGNEFTSVAGKLTNNSNISWNRIYFNENKLVNLIYKFYGLNLL